MLKETSDIKNCLLEGTICSFLIIALGFLLEAAEFPGKNEPILQFPLLKVTIKVPCHFKYTDDMVFLF